MQKFCHSCAMPVGPEAKGEGKYCQYCCDEQGNLKPREAVRAGIAQWLAGITPEDTKADYNLRADAYMQAMPAWARH